MGIGDNDSLRVYVRLPVKIKDELQIKDLHPDIQIVQLPRQKSRRWCFVTFQDEETRDRVIEHLQSLKINGKKIVVKSVKKRKPRALNFSFSEGHTIISRLELLKEEQ